MRYPQARLLVFSKAPEPGRVKTRLIPLLGAAGAAALYADLLDHTLDKAVASGLCPVELWCTPDTRHAHFERARTRHPLCLRQQPPGDLGQRMSRALQAVLQEAQHAVLIGADCPALAGADLEAALQALAAGADVVLGPAADGGYYLVGMSAPRPYLFEGIRWGTPGVLATTLARCRRQGLRWHCLPEHADLDTPGDFAQAAREPGPAARHAAKKTGYN